MFNGLCGIWLLLSLLISPLYHASRGTPVRLEWVPFAGLSSLHLMGCLLAGGYGGDLVFGREGRAATLFALRLLPQPADWFLACKLAFPVYALLVVWSAGIPLDLLAIRFQLATTSVAVQSLTISAWAGLAALIVSLLCADDAHALALGPVEKRMRSIDTVARALMVVLAVLQFLYLTLTIWLGSGRWSFFGLHIPSGVAGTLLTVVLGSAAVIHSREVYLGELASGRATLTSSLWGLAVTVIFGVGALWYRLPIWGRWLALGVPLLLLVYCALRFRRVSGVNSDSHVAAATRKGDPWAARELDWLAARWTNPLYLRDLRAVLAGKSLRRRLLFGVVFQSLLLGLCFLLTRTFGGGASGGLFSWIFNPALSGSMLAVTLWSKEKSSGTLPLLLITPISSEAMLLGRLVASFLVALPLLAVPAILVTGGLVWLGTTRFWPFAFGVGSQLPVLLSAWVAFGCSSSTGGQKVSAQPYNPLFHVAQGGVFLLIPLGIWVVVSAARYGLAAACGLSLVVAALHGGFTRLVFREYVRKLDAYRHADIDPAAI